MVDRLVGLASRIRRALALLIIGAIAGAILGELGARAWDRICAWADVLELADDAADWIAAGGTSSRARPSGLMTRGTPDWYTARALADEAEHYADHPIRLTVPSAE